MTNGMKISYSGVRGIVGESLTEEVAARLAQAFLGWTSERAPNPLLVLGYDTRPSAPMLRKAVLQGLASITSGCRIVEIGVVPTPTVQVAMSQLKADAGLIITASHNPLQWNGFKFLTAPHNIVLDGKQINNLFERSQESGFAYDPDAPLAPVEDQHSSALGWHLTRVLRQIDPELIRARRFRVALDPVRGAGTEVTPMLLEELGCQVIMVEADRQPEPTPQSLGELCRKVKEEGCDIGLAQDLDADRLSAVSEAGEAIGEERTLALAVKHLLIRSQESHPVVVKNTSTSRMIDDLAESFGAELKETKVGEVNLSQALVDLVQAGRTAFGGEGNGGVIYPPVIYGRDSLIGMALILEYLATSEDTVSQLASELPHYHIIKDKIESADRARIDSYLDRIKEAFADQQVSEFDGIKVSFQDGGWCQARASNTEPIARIIAEGRTPEQARKSIDQLHDLW